MMHAAGSDRLPSTRRTLLAAMALALLPVATAVAQDLPRVRVTHGDPTIRAMRYNTSPVWRLMRAETGMVFDVIDIDGDAERFLESNYYLILLPRDQWGTQWAGWISGRYVEMAPPRPPAAVASSPVGTTAVPVPSPVETPTPAPIETPSRPMVASAPLPAETTTTRRLPDLVLRFAFDRSDLSEAAKSSLATALTTMQAEGGSLSFALGGHTDATGPDDYNHKLGLARAEAVRQFIVEQLQIQSDRVSVSSHGETQPVAPNTTREGRAENRRVVVTVTAAMTAAVR